MIQRPRDHPRSQSVSTDCPCSDESRIPDLLSRFKAHINVKVGKGRGGYKREKESSQRAVTPPVSIQNVKEHLLSSARKRPEPFS